MSNTTQKKNDDATLGEVLDVVKLIYKEVQVLKTDVSILKSDVATLKSDVAILKTDVATLKTDVKKIDTRVSNLENGQAEIKEDTFETRSDIKVLSVVQDTTNEKISDMKYFLKRDSEKLEQVYDERKTVIHKFGMPWALASIAISIASVGVSKIFFF